RIRAEDREAAVRRRRERAGQELVEPGGGAGEVAGVRVHARLTGGFPPQLVAVAVRRGGESDRLRNRWVMEDHVPLSTQLAAKPLDEAALRSEPQRPSLGAEAVEPNLPAADNAAVAVTWMRRIEAAHE